MTSQEILDAYEHHPVGQLQLFSDPDYWLRREPFKAINPEFDREALVHWWMNVYVPDGYGDFNTPYDVYKTWDNALYGAFPYINRHGYNGNTNQTSVDIKLHKNEALDPQLADLEMWLPHVKATPDDDGVESKKLGIFEHTLSEGGVYSLRVYDADVALWFLRYYHSKVLKRFPTVTDAAEYVKNNHWYKE